jgi:sugar (pentulose or hexulose) kinase
MRFIGIDVGTSFIKGAVLDLDVPLLKHIQRLPFPTQLVSSNPKFCEFDPHEIVSVIQDFIGRLFLFAPDCAGIVMCGQMHGMVLMNDSGEILSRCLTWRDQRAVMQHPSGSGTYFEIMTRRVGDRHLRQLGNELRPGTPSGFLFWLAEQGKLQAGVTPVSIAETVLSVLCASPPSVDVTNAMAYGLLNLETMDWHREVIEELGLGAISLPELRKHGEIIGYLKLGGRFVPCYTPVGDYQCALLGAFLEMDELSLNVSTGSQVSRLTDGLALGDYQTRPFFEGRFLNTFTHIPAGRGLDCLVGFLSELAAGQGIELADHWPYIARQVEAVGDTDLHVDLNFFASPFGDRGMISGIRHDNLTVGHLFRAAFNEMTDRYYDCAQRIWPDRGWRRLVLSGGLIAKLKVLREIVERRFQASYRLPPEPEDTLSGLLVMALVFTRSADSVDQAMHQLRAARNDDVVSGHL